MKLGNYVSQIQKLRNIGWLRLERTFLFSRSSEDKHAKNTCLTWKAKHEVLVFESFGAREWVWCLRKDWEPGDGSHINRPQKAGAQSPRGLSLNAADKNGEWGCVINK